MTIENYLRANDYPGRGIILGRSDDGMHAYLAYFIMGRSLNSRNRLFVQSSDGIVTQPADLSKLEDPSLIIYTPVRTFRKGTIVTNGDHTDTIYNHLSEGDTIQTALHTRTFEPDAPNFTPRISGYLELGYSGFAYTLSLIKTTDNGASKQLYFWEFPEPQAGKGHFIHTYARNEDPLPPFEGEPIAVNIKGSLAEFGEGIWNALDNENKISLYVKSITLDGEEHSAVYNKYHKIK